MSDVFHARVTAEYLGQIFATMALTPQHTYQILTKRPNRMRDLLGGGRVQRAMQETLLNVRRDGPALPAPATRMLAARVTKCPWPLPNVWLGTSIECDEYSWRAPGPSTWCKSSLDRVRRLGAPAGGTRNR
jgi:protein gp37